MKKSLLTILTVLLLCANVEAQDDSLKTKFYDFDDLLINGEYRKPQVMYLDTQSKVRFERLLKLKKDLLSKIKETHRDPSLR